MKKTLLLSVVASTMIMAGGDIAPVEPVVVAEEVSAWEFSGSAVAYTQTIDKQGISGSSLFSGNSTAGELALSLRAVNSDLFYGVGVGAEVSAIGNGNDNGYSAWNGGLQDGYGLTQGYLTYGMDSISTSIKLGRQHLPKSLSPFAFTEGWQAVKNSFDAALLVNSSLPDTTLVYAYVTKSNGSVSDLPVSAYGPRFQDTDIGYFSHINPSKDGVHMVTGQNKSLDSTTLTGTWYIAPSYTSALGVTDINGNANGGDVNIWWLDATYNADMFTVAAQGGQIVPDGLDTTTAWGAKISGDLGMFNLLAAYSSVDDGDVGIVNLGTNVKTPLYTQSILDQDVISKDADSFKLAASMKALSGKFGFAWVYADMGDQSRNAVLYTQGGATKPNDSGTYNEFDFTYKTKVGENTTLFAAYVYQDDDRYASDIQTQNFVRFWARYNF